MSARLGSMFTGAAGLDLAVRSVLNAEPVWHAEHEPPTQKNPRPTQAAARLLAHRYPHVPNLGDVSAIDWATVPPVDVLTGGFPCTDVSTAGKRGGMRRGVNRSGLWGAMATAIDQLRPSLVIAENVRGLLSAEADSDVEPCPWCLGDPDGEPAMRGLGAVLADLADIGYDAEWCGLRAADVGACHGRFRIFILAWPADTASGRREGCSVEHGGQSDTRRCCVGVPPERRDQARAFAWPATDTDSRDSGRRRTAGQQGEAGFAARLTADATDVGRERRGAARDGRHGSPDLSHDASDADRDGQRVVGGLDTGRRDADRRRHTDSVGDGTQPEARRGLTSAADAEDRPESVEPGSDDHRRALDRPQPRAGARDRAGESAARVPVVGRDTGTQWGVYAPAVERWGRVLGRVAPAPTEPGPKGGQRLSSRFVEWMLGYPAGWVCDVPGISRNDQLKILGNSVVSQQGAAALRLLLDRSVSP